MPNVIRPTWTPENDEQRRLIAEAVQAMTTHTEAEERLWQSIRAARAGGVAMTYLLRQLGLSSATVYRKLSETE